jgi:hypothetical protein
MSMLEICDRRKWIWLASEGVAPEAKWYLCRDAESAIALATKYALGYQKVRISAPWGDWHISTHNPEFIATFPEQFRKAEHAYRKDCGPEKNTADIRGMRHYYITGGEPFIRRMLFYGYSTRVTLCQGDPDAGEAGEKISGFLLSPLEHFLPLIILTDAGRMVCMPHVRRALTRDYGVLLGLLKPEDEGGMGKMKWWTIRAGEQFSRGFSQALKALEASHPNYQRDIEAALGLRQPNIQTTGYLVSPGWLSILALLTKNLCFYANESPYLFAAKEKRGKLAISASAGRTDDEIQCVAERVQAAEEASAHFCKFCGISGHGGCCDD